MRLLPEMLDDDAQAANEAGKAVMSALGTHALAPHVAVFVLARCLGVFASAAEDPASVETEAAVIVADTVAEAAKRNAEGEAMFSSLSGPVATVAAKRGRGRPRKA